MSSFDRSSFGVGFGFRSSPGCPILAAVLWRGPGCYGGVQLDPLRELTFERESTCYLLGRGGTPSRAAHPRPSRRSAATRAVASL
jgi:hypothetical protein